jgi:hypothetical protein
MSPLTGAERQQAYRDRKAAASASGSPEETLVREFCLGLIGDANAAVKAGDCPPWLLSRSASAVEVLDGLTTIEEVRPSLLVNMVCLAAGAKTAEERERAIAAHEAAFIRWLRSQGKVVTKVAPLTATRDLAVAHIKWANDLRLAGNATAASLTVGLNAARRLTRGRAPGSPGEWRTFTAPVQLKALRMLTEGDL